MPRDVDQQALAELAEEGLEHLRMIRKYTGWIAFLVVLVFVLS